MTSQGARVRVRDVDSVMDRLTGVRRTIIQGLAQWRLHGRVVARQLDESHVVLRSEFDYRDSLVRRFPDTFSVSARYKNHTMVIVDLAGGDADAIEDACVAAWELQRRAQ